MYTLRHVSFRLNFAVLLLTAIASSCQRAPSTKSDARDSLTTTQVDTTAHIVMQVNKCSRLYTSEYEIHKVVTHSDKPTVEGQVLGMNFAMPTRIGERKVAIPITVTLKAYIDFSTFSSANVQRTPSGGIQLTLPDPQVVATASRVDHDGVRQYIDLTRSRYSDEEISNFARQGADSIMSHATALDIVAQAQRSAAELLVPMLRRMGYDEAQITISFRNDFNEESLFKKLQLQ